jgi:GTP pyrophosphokinase
MIRHIEPENTQEVEKGIFYLVAEYSKSGKNTKPVVLHSIKTAFYLMEKGYSKDIIVAGLLHDLIEDSGASISDIKKEFGSEIAEIVGAVSFNPKIKDGKQKHIDMFKRTVKSGTKATIVKCTDIFDNSFYIKLVDDVKFKKYLVEKIKDFLKISEPLIKNEPVWNDLNNQYLRMRKLVRDQL